MEASRETLWPHLAPRLSSSFHLLAEDRQRHLSASTLAPAHKNTESLENTGMVSRRAGRLNTFLKIHPGHAQTPTMCCCVVLAGANCSTTLIVISTRVNEHCVMMAGDRAANY